MTRKDTSRFWIPLAVIGVVAFLISSLLFGSVSIDALPGTLALTLVIYFLHLAIVLTIGKKVSSDLQAMFAGLCFGFGLPSIFFRISHWPGAKFLSTCSTACGALLLFIAITDEIVKSVKK